jgi:hypothetical protein
LKEATEVVLFGKNRAFDRLAADGQIVVLDV